MQNLHDIAMIDRIAVSVVVPCFNEVDSIGALHNRVWAACRDAVGDDYEIVYVNDGSKDATWARIYAIMQADAHVIGINLSRNFGHQIAVTAGLEHTQGRRVLIIDADLQDPPELLKPMLALMIAEGADVVYGQRTKRNGESRFKLATASLFYRLFRSVSDINLPADTGDFRLISRRVVETLQQMPEQQRFLRGMVAWVGFRQVAFHYERDKRAAGESNYPLKRMLRFSMDAFTGFSILPLRFATLLSLAAVSLSLLIGIYIAFGLLTDRAVPGWASVMLAVVFFSSAQLLVLGIMGEYIGRLMMESKRRPLFLVDAVVRRGTVHPFETEEHIHGRS